MRAKGFCLVAPAALETCFGVTAGALSTLEATWNDLPRDGYLKDGGKYRARRHSSFVQTIAPPSLVQSPHRAHWQPLDYNALHGGIERWFEPISPAVCATGAWQMLVQRIGEVCARIMSQPRWFIEAHQFRIDTVDGIGRPTPEGAHRDGVDFVAVVLVNRHHVKGGETRVFEANGPSGVRFTLTEPWSVLLLDDARVIHESTPIQPDGHDGARDTLVLTYRADGFQDPT
jgi:hypothetical protein